MNRKLLVRCLLLAGWVVLESPLRASGIGGGTLNFNNHVAGADAPVFDSDGVTRLASTNFLADLCAGPSLETMVAVGPARPFHTGAGAGYVNPMGDSARTLANVAPGGMACVRMRAWATADGASFEEAVRNGGRFGQSKVITVATGGAGFPPALPANLVGLESFSLGQAPYFIRELSDITAFAGEIVGFKVEVANAQAASCQWLFNGSPIPGAVGFQYFVTASTMTAGAWQAQVSYAQTNLLSRSAVLTVLAIPGGATLRFTNRLPGAGLDAPVFDLDGSTRLAGPAFVAQLRAGTNPGSLEAMGDPVPFLDGVDAGYWKTSGEFWRSVPGITPGQKVWAQVEVWEIAKGDSYETSLANGGKVGKSELIEVVTGGEGSTSPTPAPLNGLASIRVDRLPVFTLQPASQSVVTEAPVYFHAQVESYSHASLQWYFNGAPLPGATNADLSFASAGFGLAGQYTLVANNAIGSATSAVATLEVKAVYRGGTIRFSNRILGSALDAPVWDVDGTTRLAGDGFVAELWAGPDPDTLAPAWPRATFRTGDGAGYVNPGADATRILENVAPGTHACAQIRVWELAAGATYAEAVAAGGKAGQSAVVELVTGGAGVPPSLPAELAGLTSFALGEAPEILRTTSGNLVRLAGETVVLEAEVRSYSPLQYRWEHNGQVLAGANGPALTLRDLALEQSGEYRMTVSNQTGSRSAVFQLEIRVLPAGALLKFSNRDPKTGLDAPVYDLDGVTLLQGAAYAAQLFAGADPTNLVAIGQPAPFQGDPGYWSTDLAGAEYWREIPGLAPGGTAYVQIRVWETAKGSSYEEALAAGGKVAESEVLALATGGRGAAEPLPAPLTGLASLRMHRRPILVETPASQSVYPNRELLLKVRAESVDPVAYQWYLNGQPVQQATNDTLSIAAMQEADFGDYAVVVSNPTGSVTSPPAAITKLVLNSGGMIIFVNYDPGTGLMAPVYDIDGVTPLQGAGFVVQLWAGPGPNQLVPVGQAVTFAQNGIIATDTNTVRVLPNVAPDELAFVQYRAWDSAAGSSFDAAVQSGGKAGVSACLTMSAGGAGLPATLPLGLSSFQLDTALLKLSTTRSGANVAIEVSSNLVHWVPAMTVSNAPTEVLFRDPQATNEPARFYRLRDTVTSNILSSNMFGVVRLKVPPGLSMQGLPLALADATIQRAFADLPEGSTVYQYDTVARRYWINTYEFGEWSLPDRQVAPGEGCLILNPTDQTCVLTVRGNVRQGTVRQTLPQGWSMQANQVPRAGSVEAVLGLPLEDGDIVVRLTPEGEMLIDVLMGGWWGGQAPEIQMGEAFWIWKNRPTVWQQNVQWPE